MKKVLLNILLIIIIYNPYANLDYDNLYVADFNEETNAGQEQNSECREELYWDEHTEEWHEMVICN